MSPAFPDPDGLMAAAEELAAGGVRLLQYRNKSGHSRQMLEQARELKSRLGDAVLLIMNDRADLCLAAGFGGVHVGQHDLSPEGARRVIGPNLRLGVSTHNPEQVSAADRSSADYLAIGPVFPTASKAHPDPVIGLEGVRQARARTREAAGGDWRHYPGELPFGGRRRGGRGGGDIRLVTGSPQISRGIFSNLEVKSGFPAGRVRRSSRPPAGRRRDPVRREEARGQGEQPSGDGRGQRLGYPQPSRQGVGQSARTDQRHHAGDGLDDRLGHLSGFGGNCARSEFAGTFDRGVAGHRVHDDCGCPQLWRAGGDDAAGRRAIRLSARGARAAVGVPLRLDAVSGDPDGDDCGRRRGFR